MASNLILNKNIQMRATIWSQKPKMLHHHNLHKTHYVKGRVGLETYNEDFMEGWLSSIPVSLKVGWRWGEYIAQMSDDQMIATDIQLTKII